MQRLRGHVKFTKSVLMPTKFFIGVQMLLLTSVLSYSGGQTA